MHISVLMRTAANGCFGLFSTLVFPPTPSLCTSPLHSQFHTPPVALTDETRELVDKVAELQQENWLLEEKVSVERRRTLLRCVAALKHAVMLV